METVQFIADIDSDELYTKRLELAYGTLYQEILKILLDSRISLEQLGEWAGGEAAESVCYEEHKTLLDLDRVRFVMKLTLRNMADRRRRLADVAVGLTDRVLDEESL